MSDAPTSTSTPTPETGTATSTAPPSQPSSPPAAAPSPSSPDPMGIAKAAADAALKAQADAAARDARAKAKDASAKAQAEALASAQAQASALQEQLAKVQAAAKKQAAINALPGLQNADTFLPLVIDRVELDDAGNLTEAAVAAMGEFREAHPYLFGDAAQAPAGRQDVAVGSSPAAGAPHAPAEGSFSREDTASMKMVGVAARGSKDHYSNHRAWKDGPMAWILDGGRR